MSSIVYDFRQVAGPLDAEPDLRTTPCAARATTPEFLRMLSRRALDLKPPTGFVRDLVVEAKGEHAGRLDIKHGGITIMTTSRARGRARRCPDKETLARLEAPRTPRRTRSTPTSRGAVGGVPLPVGGPLRHQAEQVAAGEAPDDYVDPSSLGTVHPRGLKERSG